MATALAPVTVAAGQTVNTDLSQFAAGRILLACRITNESNLAVQVGGIIPGAEWLPGFVENLWTGTPDAPLSRQLTLMGQAISSGAPPPSTVCLITLYWLGDSDLPRGSWPIALTRFVDVGNSVAVSNAQIDGTFANTATPQIQSNDLGYGLATRDNLGGNGLLEVYPTNPVGGGTDRGVILDYIKAGTVLDGAGVLKDGNFKIFNSIESLGGQATAGSFGVPVIVAQALDVHVTATTDQIILSFTPAGTGLYRVSLHISMGNSSGESVTATVHYTDPHLGTPAATFSESTTSTGILVALNGTNGVGPNASLACAPTVVYAATTAAIEVHYHDPAGVPNDFVSATIERLA